MSTDLENWVARQEAHAATALLGAISATHLVKERPGFGQTMIPRPGSVLASPVPAAYDPDPDYFFHWFRDSSIVIDALRVAVAEGLLPKSAQVRFHEFVDFSFALGELDGRNFLSEGPFRDRVRPDFLQYVREDSEISAAHGEAVSAETRVNPDGSVDFIRWPRPQTDGPALRALTLMRWEREGFSFPQETARKMEALIRRDLAFTRDRCGTPSFDIWEEELGTHYYTVSVQAAALLAGAEWLVERGDRDSAELCRSAGHAAMEMLDAFWDASANVYRSRLNVVGGVASKSLDIAVVLAAIHCGRRDAAHSVRDEKVILTLRALEAQFDTEYAINRNRLPLRGPAMGRYANDAYYSGGAYFFSTLGAAEFYFQLATLLAADGNGEAAETFAKGDALLETVRAFTPSSGDLSEQFDQVTGEQASAKHLTWSYAAFISAAACRRHAAMAMTR